MKKSIMMILCLLALAGGCKKKKFKKVTETDAFGAVIESDLTDWQVSETETFPRKIEAEMDALDCGNPTSGNQLMLDWVIAYPNPTDQEFNFFVNAQNNYLKLVIASWSNNVLHSECTFLTGAETFRFDPVELGMKKEKYYRIYYRVHADDVSNTLSGHGDFLYMNNQEYYEQKDDF